MGALRKAFRSTPLWDVFKKSADLPGYGLQDAMHIIRIAPE
jgi:hypothetical protein